MTFTMSEFHIHVDAMSLSKAFEEHLIQNLGFWRSDFSGHPKGLEHFEPPHHFTKKLATSTEFRELFDRLVSFAKINASMKGYLEGEFVALDHDIPDRAFDPFVKIPFTIHKTTLPTGSFRQSEIHVVLNRDKSEPRMLTSLVEMGFYTAYMPKRYGTAQIFTVQGFRSEILSILQPLKNYLEEAGGLVDCSIKEERVVGWWLSEPNLCLPPVVDSIEWLI